MLPKSVILIIASSLAAFGLVIGAAWLLLRKYSKGLDEPERDSLGEAPSGFPERSEPISSGTEPETISSVNIPVTRETADIEQLALKISDPELRDYLKEVAGRIHEATQNSGEEASMGFIEEVVDRVDDLDALIRKRDGQTACGLGEFREELVRILSECGAELIQASTWDPALQRAIAKEVFSDINTPHILRYGSTGIRHNGELIRKQEVVLAVPQSN